MDLKLPQLLRLTLIHGQQCQLNLVELLTRLITKMLITHLYFHTPIIIYFWSTIMPQIWLPCMERHINSSCKWIQQNIRGLQLKPPTSIFLIHNTSPTLHITTWHIRATLYLIIGPALTSLIILSLLSLCNVTIHY